MNFFNLIDVAWYRVPSRESTHHIWDFKKETFSIQIRGQQERFDPIVANLNETVNHIIKIML